MKKSISIIIFVLSLFSTTSYGQNFRFETSGVSMSILSDKGKWTEYTKFKEAKLIVALDPNKDRITIYSEMVQFFKIVNYKDKIIGKDKTEIISFECIDAEGIACLLSIYTYKNKEMKNRLYVNYRDRIFVYNMQYVK